MCPYNWGPMMMTPIVQASLQVSAIELQRASYDELARANAEVLRKISELGGNEVRRGGRGGCEGVRV